MKNIDKIKISKEKKDEMITKIKNYYFNERDEEIGDLASMLIFDFIVEEMAPEFYNQGVYDSFKYIKDKSEDLLSIQILV